MSLKSMQSGMSMIEVLVAVLVLAIGLLGVAALQAGALRNSQSSYERSQVTILSHSLFDAMRVDRANAGTYNTGGWMCNPPAGASLRDNQMSRWITDMKRTLGDAANTCVQVQNCGTANPCQVTVRWDDTRGTGGVVNQSLSMETEL